MLKIHFIFTLVAVMASSTILEQVIDGLIHRKASGTTYNV